MSEKLSTTAIRQYALYFRRGVAIASFALIPVADALEELAAIREQQEAAPESFRIRGPGRYLQRDGGVAEVTQHQAHAKYPWIGKDANLTVQCWRDDGLWSPMPGQTDRRDLVAYIGPLEGPAPQPESVAEAGNEALRDQCAVAVYAAMIGGLEANSGELPTDERATARVAFELADAFMAERKARGDRA